MLPLKYARAIRRVGGLWSIVAGLALLWLVSSEKPVSKMFWVFFVMGSFVTLLGSILERFAKPT